MKISRNSWHYRLNDWIRDWKFAHNVASGSFTTCTYFWTTVFSLFAALIYATTAAGITAFFGSMAVGIVWLIGMVLGVTGNPPEWFTFMGCIGTVAMFITLNITLVRLSYFWWVSRPERDKPKEPSLVKSFLQDRKDRVCTIVELKD